MMCYLRGEVIYQGDGFVMLENQGVGYKITIPSGVAQGLQDSVAMYLHEVMRDNERELFGFQDTSQLELFWKLIGVSGVGPKIAQKIVFTGSVEQVRGRIMSGDLAALTALPGIGKKTAQKIILELKGVLAAEPDVASLDQDAVEALKGLGYSRKDAEAALSGIEASDTDERIKRALKRLAS